MRTRSAFCGMTWAGILTGVAFLPGGSRAESPASAPSARHRVYTHLLESKEHPDYDRRHVRPPTWETFGNRTRFATLRGFEMKDEQIVNFEKEIEKYTRTHELGDVIWPSYPIVFAKNLDALADEIKRRDLYLFDIWGYVPGSGPGGYWQQFTPPPSALQMLESKLGERWLGMDVGEQDGRYVGGYASQMYPVGADRFEQYLNFQRHFQRMCDDLGNKMCTLVSLNFGHYFLKEGVYTLIGAETAQALPNSQVYYAFIRGAGKQYGVPWFGNASVFNRWGWKVYGVEPKPGNSPGPTKGTSLNLLKRLMLNHVFYNCVFVGFESSWFEGEALSPIGRIQQATRRWVKQHGEPGVMVTPIALMVDFFSGWSFPRHLYTGHVYRVWGNLPYAPGDYLTDGALDLLYPGYQNSSYFHDESGFISPTPHGDSADCLLSDAPGWLLARYPLVVVAGELAGGVEIRDKLSAYVESGGRLVITAGNLAKLPGGLAGVSAGTATVRVEAGKAIQVRSTSCTEGKPFDLYDLSFPDGTKVLARFGQTAAAVEAPSGKGSVTVLASPFGVAAEASISGGIDNPIDKPLAKPYPLLEHVRAVLNQVFRDQTLFDVGAGLSVIVCRKGPGEYTLCVCNNGLGPLPLEIVSRRGPIESTRELSLDESEKGAVGYLPEGLEKAEIGKSDGRTVAGGDVRVFAVKVREQGTEEIPHVAPPPRPRGRVLPLRAIESIQREILARPTFFEHYDGVMIDWKYLRDRSPEAIGREAGWIGRQKLIVWVDLTSGLNLYPDLRLMDNLKEDYAASMAAILAILDKMRPLGARNLVLSLHRFPENNFTAKQSWASLDATMRQVCKLAAERKITVHLRICPDKPPHNVSEAAAFLNRVGAANLKLAPSTALLLSGQAPKDVISALKDSLGAWMAGGPARDVAGQLWSVSEPLASSPQAPRLAELLEMTPNVPVIFDAVYKDHDAEYLDVRALKQLAKQGMSR
ncbi:MAG: hypothetical protein JXQ73_28175 [Phycisphaerae bacterium]|nr:hypothetical protein [Phycisphaerae bacterium]